MLPWVQLSQLELTRKDRIAYTQPLSATFELYEALLVNTSFCIRLKPLIFNFEKPTNSAKTLWLKSYLTCMSFSYTYKTLRGRNANDLHARPETSAHEEETAVEIKIGATERNGRARAGFSLDMIGEKIKTNLERLHAQISALTEMMDRIIQGNPATEFTTGSTRELRLQSESPFTEVPVTSIFPPVAPLTFAGYSPDTSYHKRLLRSQLKELSQLGDRAEAKFETGAKWQTNAFVWHEIFSRRCINNTNIATIVVLNVLILRGSHCIRRFLWVEQFLSKKYPNPKCPSPKYSNPKYPSPKYPKSKIPKIESTIPIKWKRLNIKSTQITW